MIFFWNKSSHKNKSDLPLDESMDAFDMAAAISDLARPLPDTDEGFYDTQQSTTSVRPARQHRHEPLKDSYASLPEPVIGTDPPVPEDIHYASETAVGLEDEDMDEFDVIEPHPYFNIEPPEDTESDWDEESDDDDADGPAGLTEEFKIDELAPRGGLNRSIQELKNYVSKPTARVTYEDEELPDALRRQVRHMRGRHTLQDITHRIKASRSAKDTLSHIAEGELSLDAQLEKIPLTPVRRQSGSVSQDTGAKVDEASRLFNHFLDQVLHRAEAQAKEIEELTETPQVKLTESALYDEDLQQLAQLSQPTEANDETLLASKKASKPAPVAAKTLGLLSAMEPLYEAPGVVVSKTKINKRFRQEKKPTPAPAQKTISWYEPLSALSKPVHIPLTAGSTAWQGSNLALIQHEEPAEAADASISFVDASAFPSNRQSLVGVVPLQAMSVAEQVVSQVTLVQPAKPQAETVEETTWVLGLLPDTLTSKQFSALNAASMTVALMESASLPQQVPVVIANETVAQSKQPQMLSWVDTFLPGARQKLLQKMILDSEVSIVPLTVEPASSASGAIHSSVGVASDIQVVPNAPGFPEPTFEVQLVQDTPGASRRADQSLTLTHRFAAPESDGHVVLPEQAFYDQESPLTLSLLERKLGLSTPPAIAGQTYDCLDLYDESVAPLPVDPSALLSRPDGLNNLKNMVDSTVEAVRRTSIDPLPTLDLPESFDAELDPELDTDLPLLEVLDDVSDLELALDQSLVDVISDHTVTLDAVPIQLDVQAEKAGLQPKQNEFVGHVDGVDIIASVKLKGDMSAFLVQYHGIVALMIDDGSHAKLVKAFEKNPLDVANTFACHDEVTVGDKHMLTAVVGEWQGVISVSEGQCWVQAEL